MKRDMTTSVSVQRRSATNITDRVSGWLSVFVLCLVPSVSMAQTPWEKFLVKPSPENAAVVSRVTYSAQVPAEQLEHDLSVLDAQILAQEPRAIDLGFRLLSTLDGALAESLDTSLGRLIRPNPTLFLKHLKKNREHVRGIRQLVGNFGQAYLDRLEARNYETQRRVEALKSVKDPLLRAVRDECVSSLLN